jgi:hypothetical protein
MVGGDYMFTLESMRPMMVSKGKKQKKVIAIQNVEPELWDSVIEFLQTYRRIPSISKLAGTALENYIRLAKKYGIDEDWKIKIPDGDGKDA